MEPTVEVQIFPEKWIDEGKFKYDENNIIGGCYDTTVYRGMLPDDREVAVKRVMKKGAKSLQMVDREIDALKKSDSHDNVLRYYLMFEDARFHYLVLEFCQGSLHDLIEKKKRFVTRALSSVEILLQITTGLEYLHSTRRVHRDLKPQNILFANRANTLRAVIADFGLCKELTLGKNELTMCSGIVGTVNWMPAEALNGEKTSYPWDIFSLGCIYHYVLADGKHPFGPPLIRSSKILSGTFSLDEDLSEEAKHLISLMISTDSTKRPTASEIMIDPVFWDAQKRLDFFNHTWSKLDWKKFDTILMPRIENDAETVVTENWTSQIDDDLRQYILSFYGYSPYEGDSVKHLLRFFRNMNSHYGSIHRAVQSSSLFDEPYPEKFIDYFSSRFPKFLLHLYEAMKICANEHRLKKFYPDKVRVQLQLDLEIKSLNLIDPATAANDNYLNWLRFHTINPGIADSHCFALLSHNLACELPSKCYKIPVPLLIEELKRDVGNENKSTTIRDYLIHLMRGAQLLSANESSNYNEALRVFLAEGEATDGMENPLSPDVDFHSLEAATKIKIMCQLLSKAEGNLQGVPEWFGEDGYGNRFYLVDNGCLYVEYGAKLNELSAEEGSGPSIEKQPRKWKLIADTEKMWNAIALIMMESFSEEEIARKVASILAIAKEKMLSDSQMRDARQQFDLFRTTIQPPSASPQIPKVKKNTRCIFFPKCNKSAEECERIHPTERCWHFSNGACIYGRKCTKLHGRCVFDSGCFNKTCPFEHFDQLHPDVK